MDTDQAQKTEEKFRQKLTSEQADKGGKRYCINSICLEKSPAE